MRHCVWPIAIAAALFVLLTYLPASATTCNGAFAGLNLGIYTGALSTSGTSSGTVSCPRNFNYSIGLAAGTGSGATTTLRKMTGPNAATLNYQIFQNSGRTTNWGNTFNVDARTGTGTGSAQTVSIYPQIPANQFVVPGSYSDTINVSILNTSPVFSGPFSVVATVQAACTLSTTALAFGNYSGAQNNATATITATCTKSTSYNIGLSVGLSSGASVTRRSMTGPASVLLDYAVYRDSARTLNWGNTVGTDTLAGNGTGSAAAISVYGRIASGHNVRPGSYSDTVIATITY